LYSGKVLIDSSTLSSTNTQLTCNCESDDIYSIPLETLFLSMKLSIHTTVTFLITSRDSRVLILEPDERGKKKKTPSGLFHPSPDTISKPNS